MTDRGTRLENSEFYNGGEINEHARSFAVMCKVDVDREWAKFCDYWKAKTGAGATKKDWLATWRNWCRKAESDSQRGFGSRYGNGVSQSDALPAQSLGRDTKYTDALQAVHFMASKQPLGTREQKALREWAGPRLNSYAACLGLTLPADGP